MFGEFYRIRACVNTRHISASTHAYGNIWKLLTGFILQSDFSHSSGTKGELTLKILGNDPALLGVVGTRAT